MPKLLTRPIANLPVLNNKFITITILEPSDAYEANIELLAGNLEVKGTLKPTRKSRKLHTHNANHTL
jgi:hypothetical protein